MIYHACDWKGRIERVDLDGERLNCCIYVDTEKQYADVYVYPEPLAGYPHHTQTLARMNEAQQRAYKGRTNLVLTVRVTGVIVVTEKTPEQYTKYQEDEAYANECGDV